MASANSETGLGHYFRCLALTEAARNRGHIVGFVSDRKPPFNSLPYYPSEYLDEGGFTRAYEKFHPDWVVVDLPVTVPDFVLNTAARKCLIDGIGHEAQAKADLNISQGLSGGEYKAPEYVLIRRRSMLPVVKPEPVNGMFVFGGGADKLGLAKRFVRACPDLPANIVISPMAEQFTDTSRVHQLYAMDDDKIFRVIQKSNAAVVHMGMICWELAHAWIAPHVFSYSAEHLVSAKRLEEGGYVLAYDFAGLPESDEDFREFVSRRVVFEGRPVDGRGAERAIKLMERG